MEPFLGQIQAFGFNFPPRGWAFCDGALLPVAQNTALFSLLGTTFGGDGRTTFALPDLRGRSIVHVGSGPGLDTLTWGEKGGAYQKGLTIGNLPAHTHTVAVSTAAGEEANPQNNVIANHATAFNEDATASAFMKGSAVSTVGGSQAFNIRNPFLGIYVSIALEGIYPSRS